MLGGLLNRSDEAASACQRFKDLVGPSGLSSTMETAKNGGKVCWRDIPSEQRQAALTLETLSKSLSELRKELSQDQGEKHKVNI